jgi:hypothetical protein
MQVVDYVGETLDREEGQLRLFMADIKMPEQDPSHDVRPPYIFKAYVTQHEYDVST